MLKVRVNAQEQVSQWFVVNKFGPECVFFVLKLTPVEIKRLIIVRLYENDSIFQAEVYEFIQ
jgi:hypothetical protein